METWSKDRIFGGCEVSGYCGGFTFQINQVDSALDSFFCKLFNDIRLSRVRIDFGAAEESENFLSQHQGGFNFEIHLYFFQVLINARNHQTHLQASSKQARFSYTISSFVFYQQDSILPIFSQAGRYTKVIRGPATTKTFQIQFFQI